MTSENFWNIVDRECLEPDDSVHEDENESEIDYFLRKAKACSVEEVPHKGPSAFDIPEDPKSFSAAMRSEHKNDWLQACADEIQAMLDHNVWEVVDREPIRKSNRNIVRSKWVFKFKTTPTFKFKARLVAKGYEQLEGVDYFETFSPTMRHSTLRTFLTYAASRDLDLHRFDIGSAFLNGALREEIFMEVPTGMEKIFSKLEGGSHYFENNCLRLLKALYGLKQAPLCWYRDLKKTLLKLGFRQSNLDPCIYIKREGDHETLVGVFVDTLLSLQMIHEM